MRVLAAVLTGITLAATLSAQDGKPTVKLSLGPPKTRSLKGRRGHETETLHERVASFDLGRHSYAISYKAGYDKAKPGRAFPLEGYVGMPRPSACNWYHSGFLQVLMNGEDVGRRAISSMLVAERGSRGILDMVWHHELGDVRIRFLGLPGRDCLHCEITVEPRGPLASLTVKVRCYPSFFTSWHKRVGARRIKTPHALIKEGQRAKLPARDHWWAVYYDEVFDVAGGEGVGPCALLLDPAQASDITFAPGGYAVDTVMSFSPGTRRIRLAFWDLSKRTNAEALAHISRLAPDVRRELHRMDFTPAGVREFDVAAVRTHLEEALRLPPVRKQLAGQIAEVRTLLGMHTSDAGASSIAAEERLLQAIDKYRGFIWEVKLAELLADI